MIYLQLFMAGVFLVWLVLMGDIVITTWRLRRQSRKQDHLDSIFDSSHVRRSVGDEPIDRTSIFKLKICKLDGNLIFKWACINCGVVNEYRDNGFRYCIGCHALNPYYLKGGKVTDDDAPKLAINVWGDTSLEIKRTTRKFFEEIKRRKQSKGSSKHKDPNSSKRKKHPIVCKGCGKKAKGHRKDDGNKYHSVACYRKNIKK